MEKRRAGKLPFRSVNPQPISTFSRFRWVQCQLDVLKRCATGQELKEALDNLPTELEATYERILDAIDERRPEGKLARRALAWLVVALEPLRLHQIVDGLSVDLSLPKSIDRKTGLSGTALLDALSSLVSYHEETDIVALSHFSVKVCLRISLHSSYLHSLFRRNFFVAVRQCRRTRSFHVRPTLR